MRSGLDDGEHLGVVFGSGESPPAVAVGDLCLIHNGSVLITGPLGPYRFQGKPTMSQSQFFWFGGGER